jgi:hypothetical protein
MNDFFSSVGRITTRNLARNLKLRKDGALAFFRIGRILVMWDDKSKHAAMTSASTDEVFGSDDD